MNRTKLFRATGILFVIFAVSINIPYWLLTKNFEYDDILRRPPEYVHLFERSINSDAVIACIDKFCETLEKQTVLVVDNSSIHTSNVLFDQLEEWEEKGLTLFFLPTYSPELNIIESLWRFIKYYWLEIDAYESWERLVESVEYILKNFGEEYIINFA